MKQPTKPLVYFFDTEDKILQSLKRLYKENYEVHVASNSEAAIMLIHKQNRPGVVFMDLHFGGSLKGVELLEHLRKISRYALVCIYTSTDTSTDATVQALRAGGAIAYCIKPVPEAVIRVYVEVVGAELIEYLLNATRDMLTGLINRRGFAEIGAWEIANAARHMTTISVMMIDVDNLKPVNDQFGHLVGDKLLCAIANRTKEYLHARRSNDVFARIGGDEFVVILPATNIIQARNRARRLEIEVRKIHIPVEGGTITAEISTGVVTIGPREIREDHKQTLWHLVERADALMMSAKRQKKQRQQVP